MKTILLLFISLLSYHAISYSQDTLSLSRCLSCANEQNLTIRSDKLREIQSELAVNELKGKWWPEISLAYDYRYTPVIATTVIPVGQFNVENPSNVLRGIKMGSSWQQNTGVKISQPLIDFSICRSLKKSRLEWRLSMINYKVKREELISEICLTYLNICRDEQMLATGYADTLRTFSLLREVELRYDKQRVLVSDLNKARINHNQALTWYEDRLADLIVQKIYLAYLTGIDTDSVVYVKNFDFNGASALLEFVKQIAANPDSLLKVEQALIEKSIAAEELRVAKSKNLPKLSLDGFVGADQYSDNFDPAAANTWFGNIYVGVSVNLPILYGENISARNRRLRLKAGTYGVEAEQEKRRSEMLADQSSVRIDNIRKDITSIRENSELQREAVSVLSRRFTEQQITIFQLNQEMAELLKLQSSLMQRITELNLENLEYLKNRGLLRYLIAE